MSAPVAFCPQCHSEVAFIHEGSSRRCPICGFTFQTGLGVGERYSPPISSDAFGSILRIVVIFVLIVLAIGAMGLGLLYIGCSHMSF